MTPYHAGKIQGYDDAMNAAVDKNNVNPIEIECDYDAKYSRGYLDGVELYHALKRTDIVEGS